MAARGSLCLPHVRQTLADSTNVLGRDEAAKKPSESAVVASAMAFMGPKWRRPPVFYFSLMMTADTEKLATDSSLSTHPASVSACMALPQAREARPQTRRCGHRRYWWSGTTRQRRCPYRHARRRAGGSARRTETEAGCVESHEPVASFPVSAAIIEEK